MSDPAENDPEDPKTPAALRQALEDASQQLKPEIARQLQQRRVASLTSTSPPARRLARYLSLPLRQSLVLGSLVVVGVALLLVSPLSREADAPRAADPKAMLEVLLFTEDMELLEHLEVYEWLAAERG